MSDISSKPYEDYRCITNTSSIQYQLLHQEGVIHNANGTISIDGYYFSALGSPYGDVGQRFIFVLERADGTRHQVKIIKGDAKQDRHTINNQGWLGQDGHILEMIVNTNYLTSEAKLHGDCNYIPELEGKVIKIIRMEETNEKYNGN